MTGAVQWSTPGSPELEALEIDQPLPREVLIKTVAAGVCRSDLSLSLGLLPSYAEPPFVAGHEGAGIVVAVGSAVSSVQPGDLVVAALTAFCGHCRYCLSGHTNLCWSAETVRSPNDHARLKARRHSRFPVLERLVVRRDHARTRDTSREDPERNTARGRRDPRMCRGDGHGRGASHGALSSRVKPSLSSVVAESA